MFDEKRYYTCCAEYSLEELAAEVVEEDGVVGGCMADAICKIIDTTNLYKKNDIKKEFWKYVESRLVELNKSDDKVYWVKRHYDSSFDSVWVWKYLVKGKSGKAKKMYNIAAQNKPFSEKLYNSNFALVVFFLYLFT